MNYAILLWFWIFGSTLHPLHVSVSELRYNPDSKSVEMTHKIFIDDFENDIERQFQVQLRLGSAKQHPEAAKFIQKYAEQHFEIRINDKEAQADFVGYEADFEAIWIYQEIPRVRKVKTIAIWSHFLFQLFDDQRNIVHFDYLDDKKSFLFARNDGTQHYEF